MPRKDFIESFPGNETNERWVANMIRRKKPYSELMGNVKVEILRAQKKLRLLEEEAIGSERNGSEEGHGFAVIGS